MSTDAAAILDEIERAAHKEAQEDAKAFAEATHLSSALIATYRNSGADGAAALLESWDLDTTRTVALMLTVAVATKEGDR